MKLMGVFTIFGREKERELLAPCQIDIYPKWEGPLSYGIS